MTLHFLHQLICPRNMQKLVYFRLVSAKPPQLVAAMQTQLQFQKCNDSDISEQTAEIIIMIERVQGHYDRIVNGKGTLVLGEQLALS